MYNDIAYSRKPPSANHHICILFVIGHHIEKTKEKSALYLVYFSKWVCECVWGADGGTGDADPLACIIIC